ncbi:MAG: PDZ domain-containing protein [Planctomycetota bacterium]|nr:MAG: PDZ domain-containing protein [Planctomycetota bacterium]
MKTWSRSLGFLLAISLLMSSIDSPGVHAQRPSREELVRADRAKVEAEGFWIYNDLDKAYTQARQTGKPIVVVLRCIPCEECVKLDDELVDTHPVIRPLLDQFVCVRVVGTNGLDLNTFQFDTDQSFAVFMLNADKTIYGRFGTRSHRTEWIGDVSLEGMAAALQGALDLHRQYQQGAASLTAALAKKRGPPLEFPRPELYPSLKDKYTSRLNYEGEVAKSCIHCHQIGDARREYYWSQGNPIPLELLYPYPHPKSIGMVLDPQQRATIKEILSQTPAEATGLQPGDKIEAMDRQPLLSMADVQWVLHQVPMSGRQIPLTVSRDGQSLELTLDLPEGWRRRDDISWRVSSWPLARIALGGMRLEPVSDAERKRLGVAGMALRVKSAGKYGPHATARRQGFQPDDIIVAYDGRRDLMTEAAVFEHVTQTHRPGDIVEVEVMRGARRLELKLPVQP